MRLSEELRLIARGLYKPDILDAIIAYPAMIDTEYCPLKNGGYEAVTSSEADVRRLKVVKTACNTEPNLSFVRQKIATLEAQKLDVADRNLRRPARIQACIQHLRELGENAILDRAARFDILGSSTYNAEETVYANIQMGILSGEVRKNGFVDQAISSGCKRGFSAQAFNDDELLGWRRAMTLLSR